MNKVLNILTFIVAIVVLYGAFVLYGKRTVIVNHGDALADAVKKTATTLDQGSGTSVATDLGDLKHTKFADEKAISTLKSTVAKLSAQAKGVVDQRDTLATSLGEVATGLNVEDVDTANLQDVAKAADEAVKITEAVAKVNQRSEVVAAAVAEIAETTGVSVSADELKGTDADAAAESLETLKDTVTSIVTRNEVMKENVEQIAQILEIKSPDVAGKDYSTELAGAVVNVTKIKDSYEKAKNQLSSTKDALAEKVQEAAEAEEKVAQLKAKVAEAEQEVANINKVLKEKVGTETVSVEDIKREFSDDYYELLKKVRGNVVKINDKWGFAVINVGSKSKIYQSVGNLTQSHDAKLPEGQVMEIVRNLNGNREFVAQFKITKVLDGHSVGNIVAKSPDFDTAIGDEVYFSNETVEAMIAADDEAVEARRQAALEENKKKMEELKEAGIDSVGGDADEMEDDTDGLGDLGDDLDDLDDL